MPVYIVIHNWSNEDCDDYLVLGVFRTLDSAKRCLKTESDKTRSLFDDVPWDADYEYADETEVNFGYQRGTDVPVVHTFHIVVKAVQE